MRTIIYPGTFDPITNGHTDIINRALTIFDKLIVAIAEDTPKKTLFSLDKRVEMAQKILTNKNIQVEAFSGLLADFAAQKKVCTILRSFRTVTDYDYELQLAAMNKHLNPNIETIFLAPSPEYVNISSSLIREVIKLGRDVSSLVNHNLNSDLRD